MKVVVTYELLHKEKAVYLNRLVDMYVQTIKDFNLVYLSQSFEIFNEYGYFDLEVHITNDEVYIIFSELDKCLN